MDSEDILTEKVNAMTELLDTQYPHCEQSDIYEIGIYNGLAIGLSVLTGEQPKFYDMKKEERENGISG